MREDASVLRGGAFCGQGEHLCRGRPALGLPIAADGVDGDQGQRRGCGGRRSPSGRPTFDRGLSAVSSMKLGRPPAVVAAAVPILVIRIQISDLRQGQSWSECFSRFATRANPMDLFKEAQETSRLNL